MFLFWLITLVAATGNIILGIFAIARNRNSSTNRLFAILALSAAFWATTNFFSLQVTSPDLALLLTRLVMFFVVGQTTSFFLLMHSFPGKNINIKPFKKKLYILFSVITLLMTLTPLLFVSLDLTKSLPPPVPIPGPGLAVFILHALISVVGGLSQLIKKFRSTEGIEKAQWRFLLFATILLFVLVPLTNFLAVVIFQFSDLVFLSPVYTLVFVTLVYYSIAHYRLLDIRPVVARSVAYMLLIVAFASMYSTATFSLSSLFFAEADMSKGFQIFSIITAVILAFTFQPLKRFFDKITDHIFYRDRYETEEVLNRLGKVFVAQSNSFELLDDSLHIITQTLKTKTGHLVVMNEGEIYKIASTAGADSTNITLEQLQSFSDQLSIYDETNYHDAKYEAFHAIDAYVVLRLELQDELIGYLVLGSKQSGTIFTQQDVNLLEILSQELAVAIQNARQYEEIANFGDIMQREVMDATAKLRETNQRLVQLDEAKDEFISMASHQLRTPLTTIKGYLSMLLEGDAGKLSKKQQEFIDMAYVSSQRMVHLISDMLNVSRISTGRLIIEPAEFDLIKTTKDEIGQLRRQAKARDVTLRLHKPKESHIRVNLDENKIRQVMMNFIDNGIYYAPEGKVDVYLETRDDYVEFRVEDNGIGVPKEDQKQLFTKFYRAENARHVRPDGTGLGLYMAKQVIEAQDGEIIFNSEEGKGSTFGFRFKQG